MASIFSLPDVTKCHCDQCKQRTARMVEEGVITTPVMGLLDVIKALARKADRERPQ